MQRQDWIMIATLSVLWGGSFLFVEIGLEALTPLPLVWWRVALAALVLAFALPVMGIAFPGRGSWAALLGMAVLNNILPFSLIAVAQGELTGALASVLNATTPLFTLLLAHLLTQDEQITPAKALGLGLGFGGVVVMLAGGEMGGALVAKLCSLMAAISYACAGIFGRRFRRMGLAPLATAFGQVTASALVLTPLVVLAAPPWDMGWPGARVAGAILALAVLSTALAYGLFFRILERVGATNLSIVTFLIPVSATLLGAVVLGERLLPQHLVGFALICAGLVAIDGRVQKWRQR
ncbi:DMT family transporter [Pseudotabrizicola sp. L79]|uniref:DMT family transporter n=1 Tax=Pseudotabrizicola sp. L79 TaxID=3118402 RepID=UPI002F949955